MINRLVNIRCTGPAHHRFYAPRPASWVGRGCSVDKCDGTLRRIPRKRRPS